MTLQVCVVGCGDMGKRHAAEWRKRPDARVAAVFDVDRARADALAATCGATCHDSWREAIAQEGIGVVSICTPVCYHREIACFAAENGRHVLTEKPIALTLDEADAMIETCRAHGVRLAVSYQYRARAFHQRLRDLVRRGDFGGPLFVRYTDIRDVRPKTAMHARSLNGGPVIDMAGHLFDLMRFYTGEEPVSVFARGCIFGAGKKRLTAVKDLAIDAADILVAMSGGHTLSVFVNWGMPEGFQAVEHQMAVGPDLAVTYAGGVAELRYGERREQWNDLKDAYAGPGARIEDLVQAIRERRDPEVSGLEGRKALQVSLAALQSIETGRVTAI